LLGSQERVRLVLSPGSEWASRADPGEGAGVAASLELRGVVLEKQAVEASQADVLFE